MIAVTFGQTVDLIRAVVWPSVIVAVLIIYRKDLPKLARRLTDRLSRVSVGAVSFDLSIAAELPAEVISAVRNFIDATSNSGFRDSGASLQAVAHSEPADFAKIDLRGGQAWLTSRLYIFSLILANTVNVKRLVFVARTDAGAETFVGMAEPQAVARRLANRFPWLLDALSDAIWSNSNLDSGMIPQQYLADPDWAASVAADYLIHPLIRRSPYAPNPNNSSPFCYRTEPAESSHTPALPMKPTEPSLRTLVSISPDSGSLKGATTVTIVGSGLGDATAVWFGGSSATLKEVTPTSIVVLSPPGFGTTPVAVSGLNWSITADAHGRQIEYAYSSKVLPSISSLIPTFGPSSGGTPVTVFGAGFLQAKDVRFGGKPASITSVSDSEIRTVAPPGEGDVTVTVRTPIGSSTSSDDWVPVRSKSGQLHAEHASWIKDASHLVSLLGDALDTSRVIQTAARKEKDFQTEVLRFGKPFTPIVDQTDQFRRLVDRQIALEDLAKAEAEK
jgi:hypothetical protein